LLGISGVAVIVYGCVIAWRANASTTVLIIGAFLVCLAFIGDWESIAIGWGDRSARIERRRAERQQEAARELPDDLHMTLLTPNLAAEQAGRRAAFAQHVIEKNQVFLELILPLPAPSRPVGCRLDAPDGEHFYSIPGIEPESATRWLTYRARFPRDFSPQAKLKPGTYNLEWLELGDYPTPATKLAEDGFEVPATQ
jgi:hypothetical protein